VDNSVFYQLYDAINIGGGNDGAVNTKITNCYFDLVDRYGIYIKAGSGNSSSHNKFMLVGNDNEGYANATYPIIRFDTENNQSSDDYFERNNKLRDQSLFAYLPFVPNVQSTNMVTDNSGFNKEFAETPGSSIVLLRFPIIDTGTYYIDYVLKKTTHNDATRQGTMTILIDVANNLNSFRDDYSYTGDVNVEHIVFSAVMEDFNSDSIFDTLTVNIYNPVGTGTGTINYTYRMLTK
jgi:hypothetical protein